MAGGSDVIAMLDGVAFQIIYRNIPHSCRPLPLPLTVPSTRAVNNGYVNWFFIGLVAPFLDRDKAVSLKVGEVHNVSVAGD